MSRRTPRGKKEQPITRLCIDCKHISLPSKPAGRMYAARCKHPLFINPVDGTGREYCSTLRETKCGPRGKYWEAWEKNKGWLDRWLPSPADFL